MTPTQRKKALELGWSVDKANDHGRDFKLKMLVACELGIPNAYTPSKEALWREVENHVRKMENQEILEFLTNREKVLTLAMIIKLTSR
jgi:hypothetical protein